jgi:UDP-N-acetyl-D-glucosamine dehydrogenase
MTFSGVSTVGVVGLGNTGLPLALSFANDGVLTTGLDTDTAKIDALRAGRSYLPSVSADALVATADWFEPTSDPARLAGLDGYVLCVPVPLGLHGVVDLRQLESAADALAPLLRRGSAVEVRSAVPPGAVTRVAARLADGSGLRPGVDFQVTAPTGAAAA